MKKIGDRKDIDKFMAKNNQKNNFGLNNNLFGPHSQMPIPDFLLNMGTKAKLAP
jgi:hypothetical protein